MALNLRFQGSPWFARCRPVPACLLLLLAGPVGARDLCAFTAQGLSVVARDATADGGDGVEIDVSDGPLVLTRVAIPAADGASGCWQADLDRDRQFELLIGLVQDGGTQPARLVRYEWNGGLLEALPMTALAPADAAGYAGDEQIRDPRRSADPALRPRRVRDPAWCSPSFPLRSGHEHMDSPATAQAHAVSGR
jgi:hypothetical protein